MSVYRASDACRKLREYTEGNLARIKRGELAGSHLLGVATKAINLFETLARETFSSHMARKGVNYDQAFKPKLDKPFERLTLGEVVKGLRMLDTTQTANAEPSNQRSSATGPIRRTVSKTLSKKLDGICRLRSEVVAHLRSEEIEVAPVAKLLNLINEVVDESTFRAEDTR
jgi:hypothetical protein